MDSGKGDMPALGFVPGALLYDGDTSRDRLLEEPINDWSNAQIFAALYRDKLIFATGWGWTFYNGRHWEREDGEDKALEFVGEAITRRIAAWNSVGGEDAKQAVANLNDSLSARRLMGILQLAAGMMRMPASRFDADPYLLNVGNGIIDLRTGELLPHAPERYISMWSPVHYDKNASSQLWNKAITDIACGDVVMAEFLQCLSGYAATGGVSAQWFLYFLGEGANGKSLITGLWAEVLGGFSDTGYAIKVPNSTILGGTERAAGAPSPDLMALKGKRLALFSEQKGDKPLNTEQIKDLTGGDIIPARMPHGRQVNFTPTHTLICCGNHLPYVIASDHGFWRRMKVVPFNASFTPSRLGEELRKPEHLSAILAWMVQGAVSFYRKGWTIPQAVDEATNICRRESDPLAQWLDECCEPWDGETWTTTLFEHFDNWRTQRREDVITHSMFTRRLKQMNYKKRLSNGKSLLRGLRLRTNPERQ